jgi:ferredoxin
MSYELRVNPIACEAHGMCAELLPEMIELDPWGYPILASAAVPRGLLDHAKRAVAACPTLALLVDKAAGDHRQA